MIAFIARRLAQAVVVLLGLSLVTFGLESLVGDRVAIGVLGTKATPEAVAAFEHANGLDQPLMARYLHFLGRLIQGDLGYSYTHNQPVSTLLAGQAPRDILLVGSSLLLAVAIAIPVGLAQANWRNRVFDNSVTLVSFVLYSMPPYVPALVGISVFSATVHWLPPQAPQGNGLGEILAEPEAMVLPVTTMTLISFTLFTRYMRAAAIDSLTQDYVRTARAKGLSEGAIVRRHVLRNSMISLTTLIGVSLPSVLTVGLIVEQIFNFPGIGLEYFTAATTNDYPTMLAITVIIGVITVLGTLLADLGYMLLDPRVRTPA